MLISSSLDQESSVSSNAFSLLELVVVLAVLALFVLFSMNAIDGVVGKSNVSRASADIAYLRLGLERYKDTYGTYPSAVAESNIVRAKSLFDSLCADDVNGAFVDVSRLSHGDSMTYFCDPYGDAYFYAFDPGWGTKTYFLCSSGEDGEVEFELDCGKYDPFSFANRDNLEGVL